MDVDIDAFTLPVEVPAAPARTPVEDGDGDGDEDGLEFQYETSVAWFKGWFHRIVERQPTPAVAWCPQWWRHEEVLSILDALWTAWEGAAASTDPDAMLVWWERALTMVEHLTDPTRGPLSRCNRTAHQVDPGELALPYEPEPPGHFGWFLDTGPDGYGTPPWTPPPAGDGAGSGLTAERPSS